MPTRTPRLAVMLLALAALCPAIAAGQGCPLTPVAPAELAGPLAGRTVFAGSSPPSVLFSSALERDDDGAPNAYHRGLVDDRPDPGLDHICVGGSVLEHRDGRLVNRYDAGGSIGALGGVDPATGIGRSRLCKRDYIALRDAGFPPCGPQQACMLWYGILSEPRRCGFPSSFRGPDDPRCGKPVRQKVADGSETDFYLTTTALRRPGSPSDTRTQSDYVDASRVPYIVMPGGVALPGGHVAKAGDLALVAWRGRAVFAVVGDTGPRNKLGEASRALLSRLRSGSSQTIPAEDPATTLVFPGTEQRILTHWPLDPATIEAQGRRLVQESGGVAALRACPGLRNLP